MAAHEILKDLRRAKPERDRAVGNCGPDITVTGLAEFGFTPLLWPPQGPQWCLDKQAYPMSSNLVVWFDKMGPKTRDIHIENNTIYTNNSNETYTLMCLGRAGRFWHHLHCFRI